MDRSRKASLAADAALRADPFLAEPQTAAGIIEFYVGWDWAAAERSLLRAIELNPNHAMERVDA